MFFYMIEDGTNYKGTTKKSNILKSDLFLFPRRIKISGSQKIYKYKKIIKDFNKQEENCREI